MPKNDGITQNATCSHMKMVSERSYLRGGVANFKTLPLTYISSKRAQILGSVSPNISLHEFLRKNIFINSGRRYGVRKIEFASKLLFLYNNDTIIYSIITKGMPILDHFGGSFSNTTWNSNISLKSRAKNY